MSSRASLDSRHQACSAPSIRSHSSRTKSLTLRKFQDSLLAQGSVHPLIVAVVADQESTKFGFVDGTALAEAFSIFRFLVQHCEAVGVLQQAHGFLFVLWVLAFGPVGALADDS